MWKMGMVTADYGTKGDCRASGEVMNKPRPKPAHHLAGTTQIASTSHARSPERLRQILAERGKHEVEADADALFVARGLIHGVREICREHEECSVPDLDYDLVRILGGELGDRRPDHAGLASRVVKIDDFRARVRANVIDGAQEVVGMTVIPVRCAPRKD